MSIDSIAEITYQQQSKYTDGISRAICLESVEKILSIRDVFHHVQLAAEIDRLEEEKFKQYLQLKKDHDEAKKEADKLIKEKEELLVRKLIKPADGYTKEKMLEERKNKTIDFNLANFAHAPKGVHG